MIAGPGEATTGRSGRVDTGRGEAPAPIGSVRIRRAAPRDVRRVAEVERACYSVPWSDRDFQALLVRAGVHFLVAEIQRTGSAPYVVGHIVAWRTADEAELANLAVVPEFRRQGVAGALLDTFLDESRVAGTERVFLEVRVSNRAALALYLSRGFRQVGMRSRYYDRPREDARVLRLDLIEPADPVELPRHRFRAETSPNSEAESADRRDSTEDRSTE